MSTLIRMQWLAWQGRYEDAAEVLLHHVYAYRDGGSAWDGFPEEWRRTARENGRSVIADLHATLGSYPPRARLRTMSRPVVCTYGSRSRRYMRAITRSLAQAIPTATLRQVDGAAHAVPFDAPSLFARIIADENDAVRPPPAQPDVQHRPDSHELARHPRRSRLRAGSRRTGAEPGRPSP
jgi:pimeloyl-ACP methyl ester carboxylesterase